MACNGVKCAVDVWQTQSELLEQPWYFYFFVVCWHFQGVGVVFFMHLWPWAISIKWHFLTVIIFWLCYECFSMMLCISMVKFGAMFKMSTSYFAATVSSSEIRSNLASCHVIFCSMLKAFCFHCSSPLLQFQLGHRKQPPFALALPLVHLAVLNQRV